MYLLGRGAPENGVEAERWLKRAVKGGFEGAISVLGVAYPTGRAGVRNDIPLAREVLTEAADKGDQQSARMLQMMDEGKGMFRNLKE